MSLFEPHSDGEGKHPFQRILSWRRRPEINTEVIGAAEKQGGFPEGAKDPVSDLSVRGDNRLLASEAADINGESEDAQKSESSDPDPCHVSFSRSILLLCFLDEFVERRERFPRSEGIRVDCEEIIPDGEGLLHLRTLTFLLQFDFGFRK